MTTLNEGNDAPAQPAAPKSVEVSQVEFLRRHLSALGEVGCGNPNGQVHFVVSSLPSVGLVIFLRDSQSPVHMVIRGPAPTTVRDTRELVLGVDEAWVQFVELSSRINPEATIAAFDEFAAGVLQDIFKGDFEVEHAIWLIRWIRYRAECPRLGFDEAERLFGSVPEINLRGDGPLIDWQMPADLLGPDATFENRKKIAQRLFGEEFNDALEKFAGGVHVAFLDSWLKPISDRGGGPEGTT